MELIEGALILLVGGTLGRWLRFTRTPKKPKPIPPPVPKCTCGHMYSFHDLKTGECHAVSRVQTGPGRPILNPSGTYVVAREGATFEQQPCACKIYTGPVPMNEFFAQELTD